MRQLDEAKNDHVSEDKWRACICTGRKSTQTEVFGIDRTRSVFLVVAAFAFVVAHVAGNFRLVRAPFFTFAVAFRVEAFLVRTCVVTRIGHTIGDVLVCRRL